MAEIDANTALTALAEGTKQVTKTKKRRPARKQVEGKKLADQAPKQTGHTYNIWYTNGQAETTIPSQPKNMQKHDVVSPEIQDIQEQIEHLDHTSVSSLLEECVLMGMFSQTPFSRTG